MKGCKYFKNVRFSFESRIAGGGVGAGAAGFGHTQVLPGRALHFPASDRHLGHFEACCQGATEGRDHRRGSEDLHPPI